MIKKLDILILRAFIGPFIATFFLTLFVLILQFFWLWIDDYVGKGIDPIIMLKLVVYLSGTLVPLALPLAILLSSIMTFGSLGETFELIAIKSAGISLMRFMRPLLIVAVFMSFVAFYFNNNVYPLATLKMKTLHNDLVHKKPAFDLKEGVFYTTIPGYAIKVSKKEKDSILHDVFIFESGNGPQSFVTIAEKAIMRMSPDQRYLEFVMYNGAHYEEKGSRNMSNNEFSRLNFRNYTKALDLSSLQLNMTSDSVNKDRYEMLSIAKLDLAVDSMKKVNQAMFGRVKRELSYSLSFLNYIDSTWVETKTEPVTAKSFEDLLPDSARKDVVEVTENYVGSMVSSLESYNLEYLSKRKDTRLYKLAWHEKFSMAMAVLVLFLIGAPLGSIVRKGGIGLPVVFALIFFVIFFLLNNFGTKFVKEDVMTPFAGKWLPTFILFPIAVFLIIKALNDSQLFNKESYHRAFKKIKALAQQFKRKKEAL